MSQMLQLISLVVVVIVVVVVVDKWLKFHSYKVLSSSESQVVDGHLRPCTLGHAFQFCLFPWKKQKKAGKGAGGASASREQR